MKNLNQIRLDILKKRKLQFDLKKLRQSFERSPDPILSQEIVLKTKELAKMA